jgi:hypothetical protein
MSVIYVTEFKTAGHKMRFESLREVFLIARMPYLADVVLEDSLLAPS